MRRAKWLILCLVFGACTIARAGEPFRFPEAKHGKGELKYVNGIPVLIVAGTPEETKSRCGSFG